MNKTTKVKNIVYVAEDVESAQFRYRVKNVIELSAKLNTMKVSWVLKSKISTIDLDDVDLIVILRQTVKDKIILDLIAAANKKGVKVLFDLDDLIFDYRDLPVLMRGTGSRNLFYWIGYFWGVRRIAKKVDGFIATNAFLAEKLERSFKKPVKVIRNFLNQEQIEVSKWCLPKKMNQNFTVGYFSGSPTHRKDFEMIENELIEFLERHNDARLEIVGYMEVSRKMREFQKTGQVRFLKLTNYLKLQELMAGVEVNLAPLVLNDFTNCKSELKYFEAAIVETTTIASPTYAFSTAINDGRNGFLVRPGQWFQKLEFLHQHPDKNLEIARKAHEDALENYYGEVILKEIRRTYAFFTE